MEFIGANGKTHGIAWAERRRCRKAICSVSAILMVPPLRHAELRNDWVPGSRGMQSVVCEADMRRMDNYKLCLPTTTHLDVTGRKTQEGLMTRGLSVETKGSERVV
jgi:hypothetical protein